MRGFVERLITEKLSEFLEENPAVGRTVIEKGDTLVIISTPKDQAELVAAIQKRRV
jgi:DNA gyrase/topoisomerase IV subunit B